MLQIVVTAVKEEKSDRQICRDMQTETDRHKGGGRAEGRGRGRLLIPYCDPLVLISTIPGQFP
jgi:hypothetical protein